MAKVGILGGGSWGIALAVLLHKNGHEITVWSALESEIRMLQENHEHKMLPGVKLSEDTVFTTDSNRAVEGKDLLVMSVASSYTRKTAGRIGAFVQPGQKIVNVAKGIEEGTLMTGRPMRRKWAGEFPQRLWWERRLRKRRSIFRIYL